MIVRCTALIMGRAGQHEGLQCDLEDGHERPHRFMAPDATVRWWPANLWPIPVWEDAISTPSNDPRWPESSFLEESKR